MAQSPFITSVFSTPSINGSFRVLCAHTSPTVTDFGVLALPCFHPAHGSSVSSKFTRALGEAEYPRFTTSTATAPPLPTAATANT
eukprot:gene13028-11890_t